MSRHPNEPTWRDIPLIGWAFFATLIISVILSFGYAFTHDDIKDIRAENKQVIEVRIVK